MSADVLHRDRIGRRAFVAGTAYIEAPFVASPGDFNYLFVSFDRCCRGVNSDYFVAPTLRISQIDWTADEWPQATLGACR